MTSIEAMTGNKALATGYKLSRIQVIAAYPITPQTTVVEYLPDFVNNGELKADYMKPSTCRANWVPSFFWRLVWRDSPRLPGPGEARPGRSRWKPNAVS